MLAHAVRLARFSFFALLALLLSDAMAQQPTGSIRGVVTAADGSRIAGARITVTSETSGWDWETKTDPAGFFLASPLPLDRYEVVIRSEGFRTYRRSGVVITVNRQARLDIALELGAVAEQITVEADASALNTVDGRIKGEVSSREEILALPLRRRDYSTLAFLTPGTVPNARGRGSFLSVNGARADQTNFYVDGWSNRSVADGDMLARPNFDAVREVRMETSGYSAEYGRYAGGILHVALRSGTNDFHGAFFEQLRNSKFDSRSFNQRVRDRDRLELNRHQFGAALGGPIVRNRTFFHFSYEGFRQQRGASANGNVPTALERQGDFSQTLSPGNRPLFLADPALQGPCNPASQAACFPDSRMPASRLDPIGAALAGLYPLPNDAVQPGRNRFDVNDQMNESDSFVAKLDHQLRPADRLSFRLQQARTDAERAGGSFPQWGSLTEQEPLLLGGTYTKLLSPSAVLEVAGGWSRSRAFDGAQDLGADLARATGVPVATRDPDFFGMPRMAVSRYDGIGPGPGAPVHSRTHDRQFRAGLLHSRGGHVLTAGFIYSRTAYAHPRNTNLRGQYHFLGGFTSDAVGDLLLGAVARSSRRSEPGFSDLLASNFGFYLNDDWQVSHTLTLNLGLRYEINRPFREREDRLASFSPSLGKVVIADDRAIPDLSERLENAGLAEQWTRANQAGLPRSLVRTDLNNFAPRVGFAWRPFGGDQTVVRGGYGIFYSGNLQEVLRIFVGDGFPISLEEAFVAGPQPIPLADPFPTDRSSVQGVSGFGSVSLEEEPPTGYLQSWNFTVERALGRGTVLEAGYVGSKGTHLTRWYDLNEPNWTLEQFLSSEPFSQPYPEYGGIRHFSSGVNSNYHAGQISVRRQSASGVFFRVNYTYSKSIDGASSFISDTLMTPYNPRLDRGLSAFDLRHVFNVAGAWELPFGRGRRWLSSAGGWADAVLGGWRLSGIARLTSGNPLQITTQSPLYEYGESTRPNRIGSGEQIEQPGRRGWDYPWFRLEDFEPVPCIGRPQCTPSAYGFQPFQPGNAGRNILAGPGLANLDLALTKAFQPAERHRFELRVEAFNALNAVNFGGPQTRFGRPDVGLISGTRPPRVVQLGLRYEF